MPNAMKLLLLLPCLSSVMKQAHADDLFPEMYVFGDSLSDGGNTVDAVPTFPPNSNGPVTVKYVADALGLPLLPSYHLRGLAPEGTNFAVSGAYAFGEPNNPFIPNFFHLPTQVNAFVASKNFAISPDALYVFYIGANDVLAAGDYVESAYGSFGGKGSKSGKKGGGRVRFRELEGKKSKNSLAFVEEYLMEAERRVKAGVESEISEISKLAGLGAKNFLISTLGDSGRVPSNTLKAVYYVENAETKEDKVLGERLTQINQDLALLYNSYLEELVDEVLIPQFPVAKFVLYDGWFAFNDLIDNGGFKYTNEPCFFVYENPAFDSPAQNPKCSPPGADGFLFFDEYHPTTLGHYQASKGIAEFIVEAFA